MVKTEVADVLRDRIMRGEIRPGERVVEIEWAGRLKVSQASVREALNILIADGFVCKRAGRCAEVVNPGPEETAHAFEVRAALEGLSARLIAQRRPDLSELDLVIADMRAAAECTNLTAFYERDTRFHTIFAEKSGNPVLASTLKRLLGPMIAFNVMRVNPTFHGPGVWSQSVEDHRQILHAVRTLEPKAAQRFVEKSIRKFARDNQHYLDRGGKETTVAKVG